MDLKNIFFEVENLKNNYDKLVEEKELNFLNNGDVVLDSTYEMYISKYEYCLKVHLLEILFQDILSNEGYDEISKDLSLTNFMSLINRDNSQLESDLENLEKILKVKSL